MKIRINETYYIDVDERNHTLKEVRQTKEGKPYEKSNRLLQQCVPSFRSLQPQ